MIFWLKNKYILTLMVASLIIFLNFLGIFEPLESVWQKAIKTIGVPLFSVTQKVIFLPSWQNAAELQARVVFLEEQLKNFSSNEASLSALEKENFALHEALKWRDYGRENYLISRVIGYSVSAGKNHLILNRGSKDNIKIGLPVIIEEDFLIGRVTKVELETAIIELITDNQSVFSVKLAGGTEPIGLVSGELGLSLKLSLVPQNIELNIGDIIVTSGLDEYIPEGLVIGSVVSINKSQYDFFQTAVIELSYNQKSFSVVSIIL